MGCTASEKDDASPGVASNSTDLNHVTALLTNAATDHIASGLCRRLSNTLATGQVDKEYSDILKEESKKVDREEKETEEIQLSDSDSDSDL